MIKYTHFSILTIQNGREKGLGRTTYFKSKATQIRTKAFYNKGYTVIVKNTWGKFINDGIHTYIV